MVTIKELKKGTYFTIKNIECPNNSQVWIRSDYDKSSKKYIAYNFDDVNRCREFKNTTIVYTDFIF